MRRSVVEILLCGPVFGPADGGLSDGDGIAEKVLAANTDIRFAIQNFSQALGVQCTYCPV
jgi:hypothetical protein